MTPDTPPELTLPQRLRVYSTTGVSRTFDAADLSLIADYIDASANTMERAQKLHQETIGIRDRASRLLVIAVGIAVVSAFVAVGATK